MSPLWNFILCLTIVTASKPLSRRQPKTQDPADLAKRLARIEEQLAEETSNDANDNLADEEIQNRFEALSFEERALMLAKLGEIHLERGKENEGLHDNLYGTCQEQCAGFSESNVINSNNAGGAPWCGQAARTAAQCKGKFWAGNKANHYQCAWNARKNKCALDFGAQLDDCNCAQVRGGRSARASTELAPEGACEESDNARCSDFHDSEGRPCGCPNDNFNEDGECDEDCAPQASGEMQLATESCPRGRNCFTAAECNGFIPSGRCQVSCLDDNGNDNFQKTRCEDGKFDLMSGNKPYCKVSCGTASHSRNCDQFPPSAGCGPLYM